MFSNCTEPYRKLCEFLTSRILHAGIKHVRAPRQGNKAKVGIQYAFVEFASAAEAAEAKTDIATRTFNGGAMFVDFVGEKSKGGVATGEDKKQGWNPTKCN
jgi:hypothetical protein